MKDTIKKVITAFQRHGSNISFESKEYVLKPAIALLQTALEANLSDADLKKKADIIIAGAIISVLVKEDNKYSIQKEFGDKFLYPFSGGAIYAGCKEGATNEELLLHVGEMALIKKEIPFTGVIDYRVFPDLQKINIKPEHFAEYGLNTDPATMDTTKATEPLLQARAERKKMEKWGRPFGWSAIFSSDKREFDTRKDKLISDYDKQESNYAKEVWQWRGLAVLVVVFSFIILLPLTIPWLNNKRKDIDDRHENTGLVKREFTVAEYEAVQEKRKSVKDTFVHTSSDAIQELQSKSIQKPKKVCIALDAEGNETTKKDKVQTVVMYGDKAQAKRWDLTFFNGDKDKVEAEYHASKALSMSSK
jgi:hypothetical protein